MKRLKKNNLRVQYINVHHHIGKCGSSTDEQDKFTQCNELGNILGTKPVAEPVGVL